MHYNVQNGLEASLGRSEFLIQHLLNIFLLPKRSFIYFMGFLEVCEGQAQINLFTESPGP